MSSLRTSQKSTRREHFRTVNGVRFTMTRRKRPGQQTITPGEAMTRMLEVLRRKRT